MHVNLMGICMDYLFADGTRLLVRVHELAPSAPLAGCLPFLIQIHGPVVDITAPQSLAREKAA